MRAEEAYVLSKKYTDDQMIGAGNVTGVKGDAEEEYRAGTVNLTPANIGAYSKQEIDNQNANVQRQIGAIESEIKEIETIIGKGDFTYEQISEIVTSGNAEKYFSIGDVINVDYTDANNTKYTLPFDVVHFADVELENGDIVPGMFIQSHYAMEAVQFDQNEGFYVVPTGGLTAGTYNITMGNNWGTNVVSGKQYDFTLTESYAEGDILQLGTASSEVSALPDTAPANWRVRTYKKDGTTPASMAASPTEIVTLTEGTSGTSLGTLSSSTLYGTSGMNNMQRSGYGYNRWSQSALRQRLNSAAAAGSWWTAQNPYDRRPNELATLRGFMAGFDEAFLNIIKPVKVVTVLNTVSDTQIGASDVTYDTFFPASLEQEYIVPQVSGVEGEYWEYWKERLGLDSPQEQGSGGTNAAHIRYGYNAKTTAQNCRLRSASRGNASYTWYVTTSGYAYNYYNYFATSSYRCAPACVIC